MTFGQAKCAYIYIERGKQKSLGKNIEINGLSVRELKEGEQYTYLGQDESVGFDGPQDRVKKEYKRRVRKTWNSELYSNNKITARNTFAIPVLALTIGILIWTKKEIQHLDVETKKIITYTGSLHKRSDTSRVFVPRKQGGRGLTSVEDMFISRVIALEKHIQQEALKNPIPKKVKEHEQQNIIRLSMQFKQELGTVTSGEVTSDTVKAQLKRRHLEMWKGKPLHGYLPTKIEKDERLMTELQQNE